MNVSFSYLFTFYLFPPGRAIHALERVLQGATALTLDEIAAHAAIGIVQQRKVMALFTRYRTGRTGLYGPDTFELDGLVDRGLSSVDGHLEGQVRLFPAGHARADAAAIIRTALFPEGVAAITSQSFVQQRVSVDELITAYHQPALEPARASLPELDAMIERVTELNQQYGANIDAYDRDRPSREALREAQELGQNYLLETAVLIMAQHVRSAPEQREAVAALLEPILRQNEAVRETRRRRQPPRDIDPGTGVELPGDDLPAEQNA